MKKNFYLEDDQINLVELIRIIKKSKTLIICVSIFCSFLAYIYVLTETKEFQSRVTIKHPSVQLFEPYNELNFNFGDYNYIFNRNNQSNNNNQSNSNRMRSQFIDDFESNLMSLDNLSSFAEQSKEIDNFKEFLKKRNTSVKEYFRQNKFGNLKDKNQITNTYYLIFTKELEGSNFLNSYIIFTKNITITNFKSKLAQTYASAISEYEHALDIAKEIKLENPILKSFSNQNTVMNEPEALFYRGSKVLSQQILFFNKQIASLNTDKFDYNPLLDQASFPSPVSKKSYFLYIMSGLGFGFFLSLLIIFFRNILNEA
jgi:LPS O-antigen subunit length determinant protein (WzzB/FepE family)